MNELARRDLMTCLGTWLALEIVGFGILPTIVSSSPTQMENWFLLSLPLGIGGAFFTASGTQLFTHATAQETRVQQRLFYLLSGLSSCLGLVGIGFPLVVITVLVGVELLTRLQG
jgi:hypothetical protein